MDSPPVSRHQRTLNYGFIPDHPARTLSGVHREMYLCLVALVAIVDSDVGEKEMAFFLMLGQSLGLSKVEVRHAVASARTRQSGDFSELLAILAARTPDRHLLVLETALAALADGPLNGSETEALAELMGVFHYEEDVAEWMMRVAIALTSGDGHLLRACYEDSQAVALPLARVMAYVTGTTMPVQSLERKTVRTGERLVIDADAVLERDLIIEAGAEVHVVGATLKLQGTTWVDCHGLLTFDDARVLAGPGGNGRRMVVARKGARLLCNRTEFHGADARPGLWGEGQPDLVITACSFQNLKAEYNKNASGGAIFMELDGARATLDFIQVVNSVFSHCHAARYGGAIHITGPGKIPVYSGLNHKPDPIRNCLFSACSAGRGAGAIYLSTHGDSGHKLQLALSACRFEHCTPDETSFTGSYFPQYT
jgi:hypothetical protein